LLLLEHLLLFSKFSEDLLGREVEIDLCGRQAVVAEEPLQAGSEMPFWIIVTERVWCSTCGFTG
jgi:hypothetical protein